MAPLRERQHWRAKATSRAERHPTGWRLNRVPRMTGHSVTSSAHQQPHPPPLCSPIIPHTRQHAPILARLLPPLLQQAQQARSRCPRAAIMGRGPETVFEEYCGRRKGLLRALTTDVDKFFAECDPERENLCLYGMADGTWAVDLPVAEVPPETPEPALGINFARDGMARKDWLALVAVHSDSWLLAIAFYKGARLSKEQRDELFVLINSLPTCYEVVSGKAKDVGGGPHKGGAGKRHGRATDEYDDDDDDDAWRDGEGDPCPGCGRLYKVDEFWIACDRCDNWWCGRCSKMTAAKAEKVPNWCCYKCTR